MEKKTSKRTNKKTKKGVKKVNNTETITLNDINLEEGKETRGNIVINADDIPTTGLVSIPTEISTIIYNNAISTDIIQNKIAELKEQRAKATGTLRIYTVQDGYNFQIQVLEELLKEVK